MPRERYQRGHLKRVGKRTKLWRGFWYVYVTGPDGKERRVHRSTILGDCKALTRSEAQKRLEERIEQGDAPQRPVAPVLTVRRFVVEKYLPAYQRTWSRNTQITRGSQLRKWVLPAIGDMPISDVRKMHIVELVNAMADAKQSHKSIHLVVTLCHAIFAEATENKLIDGNPVIVRRIEIPAPKPAGAKPTLSIEQIRTLFARTSGRVRLMFRLLVLCGLRIGEAIMLRWRSVEGSSLRVSESHDTKLRGPKATKTERIRLVPLPADLVRELAAFRAGAFFSGDDDFIFGAERSGRYISRTYATDEYLVPARESTGLGDLLDFRICRRTLATQLKESGAHTKDIQAILGHTTEQTTSAHYIQPVEESQRAAVERFAAELVTELVKEKRNCSGN